MLWIVFSQDRQQSDRLTQLLNPAACMRTRSKNWCCHTKGICWFWPSAISLLFCSFAQRVSVTYHLTGNQLVLGQLLYVYVPDFVLGKVWMSEYAEIPSGGPMWPFMFNLVQGMHVSPMMANSKQCHQLIKG